MSKRLPSVTSDIPRDLRTFIDRLRELVSGDGADKLLSAQDLANVGVVSLTTNGAITLPAGTAYITTPPAPTNVAADGAINTIIVTWGEPHYYGHAYAEIWRSNTNSIGTAIKIGMSPGAIFIDAVGPGVTRYYWVRFVNSNDEAGAYNAVSGTAGTTGPAIAYIIGLLTGQITATQLNSSLTSRIDLIDANSSVTNSVNARVAAVGSRIDTLQGQVSDLTGTPTYSGSTTYATNALVTYNGGLYRAKQSTTGNFPTNTTYWEKIGDYTSLGQAVAVNSSSITQLVTDLSSEVSARTALASQVNDATTGLPATRATLTNDYYTKTNTDSAISAAITALSSSINISNYVTTATLTNNYYTSASTDSAISAATSALTSSFNSTLSGYTNTATLNTNYYTKTDANLAISNATTNLVSSSTLAGYTTTAALQQNYYTKASGQSLEAQYTVKIDTNGYISGFGLASTSTGATPTSAFIVRADSFSIASPTGPGVTPTTPFIVRTTPTTINGESVAAGVYIQDVYIQSGSITNAKIGNSTIENGKIVSMDVGKLTAGSLGVSEYIRSTNYVAGSQGFIIYGNGNTEFANTTVRGTVYANAGTFAGALSGATGTFSGTLSVGTSPAVSGTSMTGSGGVINSGGTFALGNATTNISFNGTTLTLNGNIVGTSSIQANAVSGSDVYNDTSTKISPAAVGTGYNYFTIATLYFQSFGNKVIVDSKAVCAINSLTGTSGSQTFQVALFVDGSIVSCASEQKSIANDAFVLPDGSNLGYYQDIPLPTFVFTPNSNVHTYELKIIYSKGGGSGSYYVAAKNVTIKAVEYKR